MSVEFHAIFYFFGFCFANQLKIAIYSILSVDDDDDDGDGDDKMRTFQRHTYDISRDFDTLSRAILKKKFATLNTSDQI